LTAITVIIIVTIKNNASEILDLFVRFAGRFRREDGTDGLGDVRRGKPVCGGLMQQKLEQMKIFAAFSG
jgi:hypothetical protein